MATSSPYPTGRAKDKDDDLDLLPPYEPTDEERELIAEVEEAFTRWKAFRRPHERNWFVNAAFFRGQQWVQWHAVDQRLFVPPAPTHRKRLVINRVQPKVRARMAKFLKNRAKPEVVPATTELKDKLNARLTTKALDYAWRKLRLEGAYKQALMWAQLTGHGYWWFHWNPNVLGRVQLDDPVTGEKIITEAMIGDVEVETGSPYELLVADSSCFDLGKQPKIMRLKLRDVREVRERYAATVDAEGKKVPGKGQFVHPEGGDVDVMLGARQTAAINTQGTGATGYQDSQAEATDGRPTMVLVKELFCRPSAKYPKGRYVVVANGVVLRNQDELPYGLWDLDNPFPVVDFPDIEQAGQYWITTVCEQLIAPQREYNLLRSKVAEHLALMSHPKLIAAVQHQIPKGAWTSEAGEFVPYVAHPNIPPPQAWVPPPINADVWRTLEFLVKEIEDITHIYPEAEGRVGESKSGFQTNLLQEATDAVHAPDIRAHELRIEEAAIKIRRLMKMGYQIPRLLTVAGRNMRPEVFEFSQSQIDEHADIIVQAGSALPTYKAAKIQALLELFHGGVLGNPQDPEVPRKVLEMLEMADLDRAFEDARRDEEDADMENNDFAEGRPVPTPEFFQNHDIHYRTHTAMLKSAESRAWPEQARLQLLAHVILHVKFINPQSAIMLAMQYELPQLVADLMPQMGAAPAAPPGAPVAAEAMAPPAPDPRAVMSGADQFNPEFGVGPQGAQAMAPSV